MHVRRLALFFVLLVACTAVRAQAQLLITPHLGINLAGDAEFRRGGPGGSIAYWGHRLGVELEYMHYFHFFKDRNIDIIPNNCTPGVQGLCIDLNTRARGVMGSAVVLLGSTRAKWRPYGSAGVGVIHAWIEGPGEQYDVDQNNLAINLGGGVKFALNRRLGIRSDLRYIRGFVGENNDEAYRRDYGFLRATLGATFTWP
jgi:opacity protein-like surface antigen